MQIYNILVYVYLYTCIISPKVIVSYYSIHLVLVLILFHVLNHFMYFVYYQCLCLQEMCILSLLSKLCMHLVAKLFGQWLLTFANDTA